MVAVAAILVAMAPASKSMMAGATPNSNSADPFTLPVCDAPGPYTPPPSQPLPPSDPRVPKCRIPKFTVSHSPVPPTINGLRVRPTTVNLSSNPQDAQDSNTYGIQGLSSNLQTTSATFASLGYLANWDGVQDNKGNFTQIGWILQNSGGSVVGCAHSILGNGGPLTGAGPYVFTEDEVNGSYDGGTCYNEYAITTSSTVWVFQEYVCGSACYWFNYLYWNGQWQALDGAQLGFSMAPLMEVALEADIESGSTPPALGTTFQDYGNQWYDLGTWTYWESSNTPTATQTPIYCVTWPNQYQDMEFAQPAIVLGKNVCT